MHGTLRCRALGAIAKMGNGEKPMDSKTAPCRKRFDKRPLGRLTARLLGRLAEYAF